MAAQGYGEHPAAASRSRTLGEKFTTTKLPTCPHLILRSGMRGKPIECRARLSVFLSSMAMVIGPTPPGTGVMAPATLTASAKSTSPQSR